MIYKVQMLAFMDPDANGQPLIREVNVPDAEVTDNLSELLERIFYYGQNDFQPVADRCSVSVGDVAEVNDKLFIVKAIGWGLITPEQLEAFKQLDRRDRHFSELTHPTLALVVYELDDNGEANGTIHPFCNHGCYDPAKAALAADIEARGFKPKESVVEVASLTGDFVCEACGKPIQIRSKRND